MNAEILIVEDDEAVRAVIAEILYEEGYSVHGAADGLEALETLKDMLMYEAGAEGLGPALPRLILLDLMMPRMGGWELHERLLEDPLLAQVPVIVMTACETSATQKRMQSWLLKPVEYESLLVLVRRHCGDPRCPEADPPPRRAPGTRIRPTRPPGK